MIKILIILTVASGLSASDTCNSKDGCSARPSLEKALSGAKTYVSPESKISSGSISAEKNSKFPEKNISEQNTKQIEENSQQSSEKPSLENPQYMLVWLLIISGLYFYLREKKKKGKK